MRFPTTTPGDEKMTDDNRNYQTTRILINLKTIDKDDNNKHGGDIFSTDNKNNNKMINGGGKTSSSGKSLLNPYGSWSSGTKKDFDKYVNDLKSTSLVKKTTRDSSFQDLNNHQIEDMPKLSKTVHEIIDQFDSLSKTVFKPKTRKPIPTIYKNSKSEYTHSDLEEELKNFTDNLDKDFKDIYEEEIGSLRKTKSLREKKNFFHHGNEENSRKNYNKESHHNRLYYGTNLKSSSDDGSYTKKSSLKTSSKDNYDTDDSDLLADEEVRSYMSTGHGGSDSETDGGPFGTTPGSRKSFQHSMQRFKKLESNHNEKKGLYSNTLLILIIIITNI